MRRWLGVLRSLVVYWRPGRQRGLRTLYAPFVAPGDLVFDVGAHLGDRTAAFVGLGARVIALEPQPTLLPWLRRLVGRRAGVTVVPAAVGPEAGVADLAVSDAHPTLSTLADGWREAVVQENPTFNAVRWNRSTEVEVTTMDALISKFGEPRFCKIDVEGFEADVLAGLSRPLQALSIEFVSGTLDVAEACVTRLETLDRYEYNAIPGERRDFLWSEWRTADQILAWLGGDAGSVSSGDLYARRAPRVEEPRR
ncbi:MAG: FkbM family methyltransferase [Longimicrobiales bacterium]